MYIRSTVIYFSLSLHRQYTRTNLTSWHCIVKRWEGRTMRRPCHTWTALSSKYGALYLHESLWDVGSFCAAETSRQCINLVRVRPPVVTLQLWLVFFFKKKWCRQGAYWLNYLNNLYNVCVFFRELLSSDTMKDYNRARVYLDKNYKSQEHFTVSTVLGSVLCCKVRQPERHLKNQGVTQHPEDLSDGYYCTHTGCRCQHLHKVAAVASFDSFICLFLPGHRCK